MSLKTMAIINRATKSDRKYNILTFDTHERYQTQLCKTGHNFYSFRYDGCKEWDETYGKMPSNYYVLPKNSVLSGIEFDMMLSQSKFGQFQAASQINSALGLPLISLEHTLPIPGWPLEQLNGFRSMTGNVNVFISEYSTKLWDISCDNTVIHHSVDTELFSPNESVSPEMVEKIVKPHVLSVVNDFKNRDYCCNYSGWKRITEDLNTRLIGTCSEGLSEPAESIEDLVDAYNHASVFLNTSTVSPVPTSLLEAMACGCAVVSTATCMIPEIIENGVNGFISNNEDELKEYIQQLLGDKELRDKLGKAARETVIQNFSEEKFIDNWNETFDRAYGV